MVSFQHFNFHSNQLTPIILIKTIGGSLYYTLNKKIALYIAFKTAEKVAFCYQLLQTPRVHACIHTYRQKSFHASIDTHWGIQWKRKSIIKPLNRSFPKLTSCILSGIKSCMIDLLNGFIQFSHWELQTNYGWLCIDFHSLWRWSFHGLINWFS